MPEYFRHKLQSELAQRCQRNGQYSLRAFAQALGLDAGTLSRLLAGKQVPSARMARRLADALALAPGEQDLFFSSISEKQHSRGLQRMSPGLASLEETKDLNIELYRVISDWYHFAILELTYVEGFDCRPRAIAKELGITVTEAKLALDRLLALELLQERNGKITKTDAQLTSSDKSLTNAALRKHQRQFLEKAIHSLENDPIERRSVTSMTMAIDPAKLPEARKMISEFNRKLCRFLESGRRTQVYNLELALYPLQKQNSKSSPKPRSKR